MRALSPADERAQTTELRGKLLAVVQPGKAPATHGRKNIGAASRRRRLN